MQRCQALSYHKRRPGEKNGNNNDKRKGVERTSHTPLSLGPSFWTDDRFVSGIWPLCGPDLGCLQYYGNTISTILPEL
jgi:hypothetical protein